MQRCNICIEEGCGGKRNCHCEKCARIMDCNKFLKPTIRITKKCTQSCSHCCFSCSPKDTEMMSVNKARDVKKFLNSNDIEVINVMGGEFFCNPDWREILEILIPGTIRTRLVTNGDWAGDPEVPKFLKKFSTLKVSISKDRWHTNKNVLKAVEVCVEHGINYTLATDEETSDESIVPIGRSSYDSVGFFGMFACWCHSPDHMYSFLIDEEGLIYKCSFGLWQYADVEDHLEGGFDKVFKETNQRFNSVFISSCKSCHRAHSKSNF